MSLYWFTVQTATLFAGVHIKSTLPHQSSRVLLKSYPFIFIHSLYRFYQIYLEIHKPHQSSQWNIVFVPMRTLSLISLTKLLADFQSRDAFWKSKKQLLPGQLEKTNWQAIPSLSMWTTFSGKAVQQVRKGWKVLNWRLYRNKRLLRMCLCLFSCIFLLWRNAAAAGFPHPTAEAHVFMAAPQKQSETFQMAPLCWSEVWTQM